MSRILNWVMPVIVGLIAGFILYHYFGTHPAKTSLNIDTSFVTQAVAQTQSPETISQNRRNAITEAVRKVSPAVVSVNVIKINKYIQRSPFYADPFFRQFFPDLFGDRIVEQPVKSLGSGFIITSNGYVLTNEHVVGDAEEIIVATQEGNEYPATLVGKDRVSDIALLKIDKDHLPYIKLGNSDDLLIGEWAIALGNPFGLFVNGQPTVTVGVISAVDRDFSPLEGRVYEDMIQTDAAINPGNSGGPLCNADGQVIGMNTFIFTGDAHSSGSVGVGFAIPSNHIMDVVKRLKNKEGRDTDVWIGLYVGDLNAYVARMLNYPYDSGIFVRRIDRGSPADKAGLELGDIILAFNGQEVTTVAEAKMIIQGLDLRVGDKLYVEIWRNGKTKKLILHLVKYPH